MTRQAGHKTDLSSNYRTRIEAMMLGVLLVAVTVPSTSTVAAQPLPIQELMAQCFGPSTTGTHQQTGQEIFPAGTYSFIVFYNDTDFQDTFGWYPADNATQLNPMVPNNIGASITVDIPVDFGLYLDVIPRADWPIGPYTLRSQEELNPYPEEFVDNFFTFDVANNATVVAVEDLEPFPDFDFNDAVILMVPGDFIAPPDCSSDSQFDEIWTREFGTEVNEGELDVATHSSGVYVSSFTAGAFSNQTNAGDTDAFIKKFDHNGNELWTVQFSTSGGDSASAIAVDDSGVYALGRGIGIYKFDHDGNQLWNKPIDNATAVDVSVDDSGVYVVGNTEINLPGATQVGPDDWTTGATPPMFLRKYDPMTGAELYTVQWGVGETLFGGEISAIERGALPRVTTVDAFSGAVYVAGRGWPDGSINPHPGAANAHVDKLDANDGSFLWSEFLGPPGSDAGANAAEVDASPLGIFLAGTCCVSPGAAGNSGAGYLAKLDEDGKQVFVYKFTNSFLKVSRGSGMAVNDSGIYVTGSTGSTSDLNPLPHYFLKKFDFDGNELASTDVFMFSEKVATDSSGVYVVGTITESFPEFVESEQADIRLVKYETSTAEANPGIVPIGNNAAFNPDNGKLYVLDNDTVFAIDAATNAVVGDPISTGVEGREIVVNPANDNLYVLGVNGQIIIINGMTNAITGDPILPACTDLCEGPKSLAVNPANGNMYVAYEHYNSDGASAVSVIDGTTHERIGDPIFVGVGPVASVLDAANNRLYVLNEDANTVSIIDTTTNALASDPIAVGSLPAAMALNSANGNLYVVGYLYTQTLLNLNRVDVVNGSAATASDKPISVAVFGAPYAISANPANGNLYLVNECGDEECGGDNKVMTIIDGTNSSVVGSQLSVGPSPVAVGIDPTDGSLYALNFSDGVLSAMRPLQHIPSPTPPAVTFASFGTRYHFESLQEELHGARTLDDVKSIECPPDSAGIRGITGSATTQDGNVVGSWSTIGQSGDQISDNGIFQQITTDGKTFELRGVQTFPNGSMAHICSWAPVTTNETPVVVTGDCGPNSEITFAVGDEIKMVFIGDSYCIPPAASGQINLTINSVDLSGTPFTGGLWTVIRSSNGTIVETGFTPLEFKGTIGETYKISVSDFDDKTFERWLDNGSTERNRTVTLNSDTTLTAIYDIGDALRGFTPLTYTGTEEQPDLTVNAVSLDGESLHMWTIIDPQLANSSGTTYKVYAGDYQGKVLSHWGDDFSTSRVKTLTIDEDHTLTAYYLVASSVIFQQKTVLEDPEISVSKRGVDAQFTCPDGTGGGSGHLFGFHAINTESGITGIWGTSGAPGAASGDRGAITDMAVNSTNFTVEGTWDPVFANQNTSGVCSAPIPSTVTIEGPCGNDVIVRFSAANGVTGTFRGNSTCAE